MRRVDVGQKSVERALAVYPDLPLAHYLHGVALELRGEGLQAIRPAGIREQLLHHVQRQPVQPAPVTRKVELVRGIAHQRMTEEVGSFGVHGPNLAGFTRRRARPRSRVQELCGGPGGGPDSRLRRGRSPQQSAGSSAVPPYFFSFLSSPPFLFSSSEGARARSAAFRMTSRSAFESPAGLNPASSFSGARARTTDSRTSADA